MGIAQSVQDYLSERRVDHALVEHPRSASSRESAQAAHIPPDHIAKAVVVRDARGYAMVVVPASHWVRLHALRHALVRDFEIVAEAELIELFPDCQPGAIPPLGPAYRMETFLDEALTSLANVYFEAGDHQHLVHVTGEAFATLLAGARHGHFSHDE